MSVPLLRWMPFREASEIFGDVLQEIDQPISPCDAGPFRGTLNSHIVRI